MLVNNAAVAHSETVIRTKQGFEANFGANHLGHFLFTALLSPAILRATSPNSTDPARIVNLSSAGAVLAKELRWEDPNFTSKPEEYNKYYSYALSKYANIAFSKGLAKRLGPKGVLSFSLNPGGEYCLASSSLSHHLTNILFVAILQTNLGSTVHVQDLIDFGYLNADGSAKAENFLKNFGTGTST